MDGEGIISVCLVNKFYPPDSSVTAESASALAAYLISQGFNVQIVCSPSSYQGGGASGLVQGQVHRIKSAYNGKNKLRRLWSSIVESRAMIKKASELDCDYTIVMTSPPLLNFFAARIFKKKKQKWIYWSMDLYPEAFKANGLVGASNPIYKYVLKQSYSYAPSLLIALGKIQARYLQDKFKEEIESVILPCGIFANNRNLIRQEDFPSWKTDQRIYLGYIGNLGEAHSEDFLKSIIENLDESKFAFILVVYGSKADRFLKFAERHKNKLLIKDYLPREELKHIDVHLASLVPEWLNVCVPSKLVSAVHGGSSFIFYGPENSDSWHYLKSAGWLISWDGDLDKQCRDLLHAISEESILNKKKMALEMTVQMDEQQELAFKNIAGFIGSN